MDDKYLTKKMTRRDFVKGVASVGALFALSPILSACVADGNNQAVQTADSEGSASNNNKWKSAQVINQTFNLENTYFYIFDNGVKEALTALGMGHLFLQHNGDSNLMLSQVDQMAVNNQQFLISYAPTAGVIPNLAKACQENKIYLFNVWNTPAWFTPLNVGDYYVQFNEPDGVLMGYETASYLFKHIGGKGTVLHIPGYPGTSSDMERTAGIMKALKDYPDIKLVVGQPGNWNRIDSRKAMEDLLISVSSFDGVIGQNDDQAIGIVEVLKERKINVPVVGMDGTPEGLDYVKNGDLLATHNEFIAYQGGWNAVLAFDILNGYKPSIPERMMFTQSILTTRDNVDKMIDQVYSGDKTKFDWQKMSRTMNPDSWDPQLEVLPIDVWEFWKDKPVESGMGLPSEYEEAKKNGEFERVKELYASHYKMKF